MLVPADLGLVLVVWIYIRFRTESVAGSSW